MKKFRVIVEEDGSVTADAIGFKGKACDKILAEFAKELGGTVKKRIDKPEYFQAETAAQQKVGGAA